MRSLLFLFLATIALLSAKPVDRVITSTPPDTLHNNLFTVGVGSGLIGGLYDGFYPYRELKKHGDFGLGAPDKLDGEIMIFRGKIYQTQHTGKTFQVDERQLTPFSMINFFHPDIKIMPHK